MNKSNLIEKIRQACNNSRADKYFNYGDYSQIHLSDILIALRTKYKNRGFFVNEYGLFFELNEEFKNQGRTDYIIKYSCIGWNLSKDSLNLQTKYTIKFISDLLETK